jgi:hypothetical protein
VGQRATKRRPTWEDVVRELDFGDGSMAHRSHADSKARNSLLREWSVEDSLAGEFFGEALRGAHVRRGMCPFNSRTVVTIVHLKSHQRLHIVISKKFVCT